MRPLSVKSTGIHLKVATWTETSSADLTFMNSGPIQDWTVRYALASADGVSEVASIGGHVQEYQIDVRSRCHACQRRKSGTSLSGRKDVKCDVGARTIELNRAEYVVRGLGFFKSTADIEKVVLKSVDDVPITN